MSTTEHHSDPDDHRPRRPRHPPTERAWLLVARREVITRLTDKSFLIGTLITLVVIIGFLGWTAWSEERSETYTVADHQPRVRPPPELLAEGVPEVDDGIEIEVHEVASDDDGVAALEDGEADVLLRPADDGWTLVGQRGGAGRSAARPPRPSCATPRSPPTPSEPARRCRSSSRAARSTPRLLEGDAERQDFAEGMGFLLAFLFYFAALGFGYTLSGSVVEEKANRIVEIITTKIPVRQLLIGKIAGNTLLAIGQTALIVSVGLVGISFTEYSSYLSGISEGVGWFAAFFLVGFIFIACWWAVAGALASRAEDLQTTATPLNFLMMAVFFGAFLFEGTVQTVASYLPPFSIVLMPIRVLNGDAAVWEPIAALVILVAAMAATVVLAERLYRRALLQTQGRVTLKQAWTAAD